MTASEPDLSAGPARHPTDGEIDVHGLTHQGKVRKSNQDQFLIASLEKRVVIVETSLPDPARLGRESTRLAMLAMVADGVGGGAGGEEASRVATEAATRFATEAATCYYRNNPEDSEAFFEALRQATLRADHAVREHAEHHPALAGMATTLTLWIGIWPHAYLLQVGDSRAYTLREGELRQISRDQTMAQDMVDQGILSPGQAPSTRWSHVLSSAIGGSVASPVVTRMDQRWGDVGLLCTDGLIRHVSDEQIQHRLETMTSARQACEALLQDALEGGGSDNITILIGRTLQR
jgi:protein phosphatase